MTTLEAIKRLQWKHEFTSTFEGRRCPQCGQYPPEEYIEGPRSRYKTPMKKFGHLPDCWIGKAVAQAEREARDKVLALDEWETITEGRWRNDARFCKDPRYDTDHDRRARVQVVKSEECLNQGGCRTCHPKEKQ